MAAYERGNSTWKYTAKNTTEQRNLGTLAYKMKYKWGNQTNKGEMKLGRGIELIVPRIDRL
jgi:hypothetical protein